MTADRTSVHTDSGAWTSTTDAASLASMLKKAKSAVIVTHAKPDGDAFGSAVALGRCMERNGTTWEVWVAGPLPRWMDELSAGLKIRELAPGAELKAADGAPLPKADPDVCVVVDTGSWTQLAELRPLLAGRADRNVIIDHHLRGDADVAGTRVVDMAAAACTQVLAPVCVRMLGVESAAGLPLEIAEPLYLGLATDTGWLRYSSVTPATLRLAADLMEAGVVHTRLYRMIEQQDVPGRWRLLGRALESLELADEGRVAIMTLTVGDFEAAHAERTDTSGYADMVLAIASVQVAAVLTEQPSGPGKPPLTKISLRSKPGPEAVDVNKVANQLGGGGHARAAGAKMDADLRETRQALLGALK